MKNDMAMPQINPRGEILELPSEANMQKAYHIIETRSKTYARNSS